MPETPESTPLTPAPSKPAAAIDLSIPMEEQLREMWGRNRTFIIGALAVFVIVLAGRQGWMLYQQRVENVTREAYMAALTPEQLRSFAAEHDSHPLAGVAFLSIADGTYAGSRYAEAAADYEQAVKHLKDPALSGRARIGRGISLIQAGQTDEGRGILDAVAGDETLLKITRGEAACQLAILDVGAGDIARARTEIERTLSLDPSGIWGQRALSMRMTLPAAGEAPAASPQAR